MELKKTRHDLSFNRKVRIKNTPVFVINIMSIQKKIFIKNNKKKNVSKRT